MNSSINDSSWLLGPLGLSDIKYTTALSCLNEGGCFYPRRLPYCGSRELWPSWEIKKGGSFERREIRFSHPRLHIRDGYVCKELRSIHLWFRKQELINQKLLSLLPKMYALFFKTNNCSSFMLLNITDLQQSNSHTHSSFVLSLIFLLISNPTNRLRLHQFLGTKTTEANKSLKTDANGAH